VLRRRLFAAGRRSAGRWLILGIVPVVSTIPQTAYGQRSRMGMVKNRAIDFSDRVVKFKTSDGVTIEADYYPVKVKPPKKTPVAILIHMYPADRSSWKEFVPLLRKAGIAALAYDIRGRGGSTQPASRKLKEGYDNRDPLLFKDAWKDARAARKWLRKQKNINTNRMVLIGASIGCSVALEYAGHNRRIKGVVCLSPGTDYFGVNSIEHIKKCSTIPILLMSPEGEFSAVQKLVEASGGRAKAHKYPGGHEHHGTAMFHAPYGKKVQKRIMRFVKKNLSINCKKKPDKPAHKKTPHA